MVGLAHLNRAQRNITTARCAAASLAPLRCFSSVPRDLEKRKASVQRQEYRSARPTTIQCGLCFIVLAVNYFYKPMVKTVEVGVVDGESDGETMTIIDPVGHSVFTCTGALSSLMLGSLIATLAAWKFDWRFPAAMFTWFAFLASTYAILIWLISRSLKLKTSFYCIEVFFFIVFYVVWQLGRMRIQKVVAESITVRYPRVRAVQQEAPTTSTSQHAGSSHVNDVNLIITNIFVPMGLIVGKKEETPSHRPLASPTAASSLVARVVVCVAHIVHPSPPLPPFLLPFCSSS